MQVVQGEPRPVAGLFQGESLAAEPDHEAVGAEYFWVDLVEFIKNNTTQKFNSFITHELENQDQLRKLLEKEKNLNIDIKKTQQEKNLEKKEFDKEIAENQAKIQEIKEDLMEIQQQTEIEISYFSKETKAEISNQTRIFDQSEKALLTEIENIKSFIRTETLVHK